MVQERHKKAQKWLGKGPTRFEMSEVYSLGFGDCFAASWSGKTLKLKHKKTLRNNLTPLAVPGSPGLPRHGRQEAGALRERSLRQASKALALGAPSRPAPTTAQAQQGPDRGLPGRGLPGRVATIRPKVWVKPL